MNIEQMQEAVDEIRAVCRKHGVALIGTCNSEGIDGEIAIFPAIEAGPGDLSRLTNLVIYDHVFYVHGVGDPVSAPPPVA